MCVFVDNLKFIILPLNLKDLFWGHILAVVAMETNQLISDGDKN